MLPSEHRGAPIGGAGAGGGVQQGDGHHDAALWPRRGAPQTDTAGQGPPVGAAARRAAAATQALRPFCICVMSDGDRWSPSRAAMVDKRGS